MSLDTVLKIGRAFKEAENNFQYLNYLYNPKDTYRSIFRIQLPLNKDFSFDWDKLSILSDEKLYEKLYELRFKTSDSDSTVKYLYGDIFYEQITGLDRKGKLKPTKERGRIQLQKKKDTFEAAQKNVDEIVGLQKNIVINTVIESHEIELIKQLETTKDNFENKLKAGLISLFTKESRTYKPNLEIKIPKKYEKIEEQIYACLKSIYDKTEKLSLIKFRKYFIKDRSLINTLLKYSAAIEEFLSNPQDYKLKPKEILNNPEKLKELTIKYIFNNAKESDLEKLIGKNYKEQELSQNEKLKIVNFVNHAIFIHFVFPDDKMWYQYDDTWNLIFDNLINSTFSNLDGKYVLDKSIYRTLASGDKKNDIQFPSFRSATKYKSRYFDKVQVKDLLYGLFAYKSETYKLKGTDIILTLLPKGDNLSASDYTNFIKSRLRTKQLDEINQNASDEDEPLFQSFFKDKEEKVTSFDLLLVNTSGNTNKDIVEISGVKKSTLDLINNRINKIANQIFEKKKVLSPNAFKPKIEYGFQNILGSPQVDKNGIVSFKANSRYEAHLLKILPQIYCMNYYQDRILLPSFIERIEFTTRSGGKNEAFYKYNNLKYDLEFLLTIQNSLNNKFMEIINSDSYKMGYHLGKMANVVAQQINSFEKNYVGNLSRRVSRLSDFVKLKNEIIQKLINHSKMMVIVHNSTKLDEYIKTIKEADYRKDEISFGFFEGYYEWTKKVSTIDKVEKLINKSDTTKDNVFIEEIKELIKKHRN